MTEPGTNKAEETQTTVNTKLIMMMMVVVSCSHKMRTEASKVATLDLFYHKNIVTKNCATKLAAIIIHVIFTLDNSSSR